MAFEPFLPPESVDSVYGLVSRVSATLRNEFDDVTVEGEISNLKRPGSGHLYLTLKDDRAQLRTVIWRSAAERLRFAPEDGQRVVARGSLTMYESRGDVQLMATSLRLSGEGALQRAFEALKRRLEAEGLFDPARKRSLPALPRTIGIVTSGTGAVLQDMLSIIARRFPAVHVVIAAVRVQGEGAAEEIAAAVRAFNRLGALDENRPDVLIVGRGGGSLEDLWAFNEEPVARALHASGIPVVSAVGHETDTTICDLVADVRASTPSMAAELVVPTTDEVMGLLKGRVQAASRSAQRVVDRLRIRFDANLRAQAFHAPDQRIQRMGQRNDELSMRLGWAADVVRRRTDQRAAALADRLRALDPLRPLESGFALVRSASGIVRSVTTIGSGDELTLTFRDGSAVATVEGVNVGGIAESDVGTE